MSRSLYARILYAWIGATDLRAAEGDRGAGLGPIGGAVEAFSFDRIELLSNFPRDQNTRFLRWIRNRFPHPFTLHHSPLSSPTAFGEIHQAVVSVIEKTGGKPSENHRLIFHLSPGTPAMAAVWIILSKTRFPAELIESSKEGGVRTVSIPFDISAEFIPDLLRRPDEELEKRIEGRPPESPAFADIIHRSEKMKQVLATARLVAVRKVPVLIEGESGTGKELLARAIHQISPRQSKPFLAINCGAIPTELVEAELFGYERGAFTGATHRKAGHFANADGGTLFLDELGELSRSAQVKLLRVIQEHEITPLGSSHPQKIDVRVISATNRSLIQEVARGAFREDLFYRLAVFILHLPPLRDREGDVGLLIDRLLDRLNEQSAAELGLEQKKLSPGARNLLLFHSWPGNIRELQNTLLRAAILSPGVRINEKDVQAALFQAELPSPENILDRPLGNGFDLQALMAMVARHYLIRAMAEANENKTDAAKLLGLPSYQTLTNWLKKYGVKSD
jgi:DNA-binding NtrC family response regulator